MMDLVLSLQRLLPTGGLELEALSTPSLLCSTQSNNPCMPATDQAQL
jgi:hypothetical protein